MSSPERSKKTPECRREIWFLSLIEEVRATNHFHGTPELQAKVEEGEVAGKRNMDGGESPHHAKKRLYHLPCVAKTWMGEVEGVGFWVGLASPS